MEKPKYLRGLEFISESAQEYEKKCNSYWKKQEEKTNVETQIEQTKSKISELSSLVLSIDDIKKDSLAMVEKTYTEEVAEAKQKYKATNDEIDSSEKRDPEVRQSIENDFNNRISKAYEKVNSVADEVNSHLQCMEVAQRKSDELEQQINNSALEENQIKLCAAHIASNYDNVVNNAEFISDYKDPRGASPEEAQNKFQVLSPKKIKKIARKMNKGTYVSSPDECKGLPIMEILVMAVTTLWLIIKGIFHGIGFLYKPINRFYKLAHKMAYAAVVTLILLLLLLFIFTRFGDGITVVLFIVLVAMVAIFLGMILFNVIKYSNKAFRKELNLEYYTVGYFFTYAKDEIMYKIASDYYLELKTKNPTEFEKILQPTFGVLQSQKEMALRELSACREQLEASRAKMSAIEEQYKQEKAELEQQCKAQIELTMKQLSEEREGMRKASKKAFDTSIEASTNKKENAINNAEQNAIEILEKRKQDIARAEQELEVGKGKQRSIADELDMICNEAESILKDNNDMAAKYKEFDIDAVDSRSKNDKLPEELVAGLSKHKKSSLKTGTQEIVYKLVTLKHKNKPIIITCNADDDESILVTDSYYSLIDSLISDILAKTYIGAFRFVLVDSQGNKSGIVKYMPACKDSFEVLEKAGCIKVCTESSNKCFEEIIREQENELAGKNIDDVNEANKNLDNMVRHNFLCIRVYSKKTSDFSLGDFRKRIDSSLNNGIIPIVIMSQDYFDEKKSELEGTIKELCDGLYYKLDVNQNEEIRPVSI